jgi:PE-PPE domain-containing protein
VVTTTPALRRILAVAVLGLAALAVPAAAQADPPHHYFLELGGTGSVPADGSSCTVTYTYANQHLNGGTAVEVCYPSTAGPLVGPHNEQPDLTAPSYDTSVARAYDNLLAAVRDTHRRDPGAMLTLVGYSQGAQAADEVLRTLAGSTEIPHDQLDGMLYADPMQPGTGLGAVVPKGISALGFTSPGAGPVEFGGIPVHRFCIHTDAACDATSLAAIPGFFDQHPRYPQDGGILPSTIGQDGTDGVTWYPAA